MKRELQQKFYDRWPEMFKGRSEPVTQNLMAFGFDHADGWFDLEWKLCEKLEKVAPPEYKLFQVKEKFGGLRWYDEGGNEQTHELVGEAMKEASRTCEACGKPGALRMDRRWIRTLCEGCAE